MRILVVAATYMEVALLVAKLRYTSNSCPRARSYRYVFFFQAEDGIRDFHETGVQTCALPIASSTWASGCPSLSSPTPARRRRARRDGRLALDGLPRPAGEPKPVERAVFLLHGVFDYDYAEIAKIVQRSEDNCRQLYVRGRRHIDHGRPRFEASCEQRDELTRRFFAAAQLGDTNALIELLAADVVVYGDGRR